MAIWLVGDREAAPRRLGPHLSLRAVAEREHGQAKLLAGQHGEHVGLILGSVHAAYQLRRACAAVLARGDDPPNPPAVLARGDDPPNPPAVDAGGMARADDVAPRPGRAVE